MSINQKIKNIFWKINDSEDGILHQKSIKPFENYPLNFDDERVNKAVGYHNKKWFHNEIVVKVENATVEPQYGYAITGLRTIVGASIRTRENIPSPIPMIKAHFFGQSEQMKKAILFDGSMGANYFHLLSDVLHKLYLLEKYTQTDCPILVGNVFQKGFFQFLIKNTALSKYNWHEIKLPVKVEELYVARPLPYGKDYWLKTKRLFIEDNAPLEKRKVVFLNRKGPRQIINIDQIRSILTKYGVEEITPPGSLNLKEQAQFFNSCSHIIAIHGAALTNLAYCNHQKVKVLELCSNNRIGTQYYWLCAALGISWKMMLGGIADENQSFELNAEKFEHELVAFLSKKN